MCGILAALGLTGDAELNRRRVVRCSRLLRHRGPDASGIYQSKDSRSFIAFERLQIVDTSDGGRQPFVLQKDDGAVAWALNSEIYNHAELRRTHLAGVQIVKDSHSDSAVVGHLYDKLGGGPELWNALDGIFACVLLDERSGEFMAARDPMGVCPLYWGRGEDGSVWFASEMKALQHQCQTFELFPPGHFYHSRTGKLERYYNPAWIDQSVVPKQRVDLPALQQALVDAVTKRLMADVPYGVLLSGGLDSSLIASIANRAMENNGKHQLHSFSVGLAGSPDLKAAAAVARQLGTAHHEFTFTVEEGIDALHDLIYHIESYEQVRAAVPLYILSRRIKALGFKMVLSGEGADEIFGGYLYFHKAPSPAEFHKELVRKVTRLHQWDVLRANKAPFAWGLEVRVPFLDKHFLELTMGIAPEDKQPDMSAKPDGVHPKLEKYILRKAFDTPERPYLPEDVLWRQKEQFSDGVGYDWVDGLKAYAQKVVSDGMWDARAQRFPDDPPRTREYYVLRSIFEEHFPSPSALATVPKGLSVACSTPEAIAWDKSWADQHEISGRAIGNVHLSAYDAAAAQA